MKNLKQLISESNTSKSIISKSITSKLFSEVQNEVDTGYAYSTIAIERSREKYKNCILIFSEDSDSVSFVCYNTVKDFIENVCSGFDIKEEWYEKFEEFKAGDSMEMNEPGYYVIKLY